MQQIDNEVRLQTSAGNAGGWTTLRARQLRAVPRRRSWRRFGWVAAAAVAAAAGAVATLEAARIAAWSKAWPGQLEAIAVAAGLGIDEVSVTGHRFTADSDILDSLDLANVRTMTALDARKVRARIERLPWIATATVTRLFPGRIAVAVTERRPFAVWSDGDRTRLIDADGRVLDAVSPAAEPALPRVAGRGAPAAARALFEMLADLPPIAHRVTSATRVDDRRWSLTLSGNVRVELPPTGEASALATLLADPVAAGLLDGHDRIVDLRASRDIAVRPLGAS